MKCHCRCNIRDECNSVRRDIGLCRRMMKTGISEELCIYLIQLYPEICQILLIFDRVVNNVHGIVNVKILQIFIYTRESACAALNGAQGNGAVLLIYKAEILI